jgi:hypothetical protein
MSGSIALLALAQDEYPNSDNWSAVTDTSLVAGYRVVPVRQGT